MIAFRNVLTAVGALLLATAAAHAQGMYVTPSRHLISVGFGGGVSVPVSDYKDAFKNGVNGEGFVLVQPPGGLPALRFNLSYQKFNLKDAIAQGEGGAPSGSSRILGGIGGLSMNLLQGPIRPYITAGLGAFNVNTVTELASGDQSVSSTNFGIDGGAGLALHIGRIDGFAEGHLQNVYTRNGGLTNAKSIQFIPVTFGITIGL
ncbi:MAG: hypothetical protein M3068_02400 [Gemmatimonadota bacterium]|nr:hypothetical protein [Gemmatimonadota bacterium]